MTHSRGAAGADPDWLPQEINTDVAHPARVYDYWLGGKDNFPADRALAEHIMQAIPTMRRASHEHDRRETVAIGDGAVPTAVRRARRRRQQRLHDRP
jgi:hypothetical protein